MNAFVRDIVYTASKRSSDYHSHTEYRYKFPTMTLEYLPALTVKRRQPRKYEFFPTQLQANFAHHAIGLTQAEYPDQIVALRISCQSP
jgi:hypothetical protein